MAFGVAQRLVLRSSSVALLWGYEVLSECVLLTWAWPCQRPQCLRPLGTGKAPLVWVVDIDSVCGGAEVGGSSILCTFLLPNDCSLRFPSPTDD